MGAGGRPVEGVLSGLVQLGVGGIMAAALIWFLHYLVTKTLPELTATFRTEVATERTARREDAAGERSLRMEEHRALLAVIDRVGQQQREEHEKIMDRLDFGFKEMIGEITENRQSAQRILDAVQDSRPQQWRRTAPRQPPKPGDPQPPAKEGPQP
jgi:hypothetical protein